MPKRVIRIEMESPTKKIAKQKFPEAKKQFTGGLSGMSLRATGLSPKIMLEDCVVAVEIVFPTEKFAAMLLPKFKEQMYSQMAKEVKEKGDCIDCRVFLKEA